MTDLKIRIQKHNFSDEQGSNDHVESISLVHEDADALILHINLKTKHKRCSDGGGHEGCHSLWLGNDEVQLHLPERFDRYAIFTDAARYTIFVCIFNSTLLDGMADKEHNDVVLWDRPEDSYDTVTAWPEEAL